MPRCKNRFCRRLDGEKIFKPIGVPKIDLEEVHIDLDEFEAIRLCDYDGKSQIESSEIMNVSRATIQRLLKSGRSKMVDGLLNSKVLMIKTEHEDSKIKIRGENMMSNNLKELKIAFPTNDGETVEEHFGHCKKFAICNVKDNKIVSKEYVDAPKHEPGVLPRFLGQMGATAIITGGMGQMAVKLFKEQNIEVILGATGSIDDNLNEYLNNELESTGSVCNHTHDENCSH